MASVKEMIKPSGEARIDEEFEKIMGKKDAAKEEKKESYAAKSEGICGWEEGRKVQ